MKKILFVFLACLLLLGLSFNFPGGADQPDFPDIYIDEGCAGTHVGSEANPYDDLSDINWTATGDNSITDYLAGTPSQSPTIHLKKGDTWRELMTVGTSGTATYPIIITSYGSGDDPQILASVQLATWTVDTGHWTCTYAGAPYQVWFIDADDGEIHFGNEQANKAACVSEYDWYDDGSDAWCYTGGVAAEHDPDTRYTSVEASVRAGCIVLAGEDYITIQNLECAYATANIISVDATSDHYVIEDCTLHHTGLPADSLSNCIRTSGSNGTIQNNTIHNGGRHGIYVTTDSASVTTVTVEGNEVYNCYHTCIDLMNQNGTDFEYVTVKRNLIYTDANFTDFSVGCVGINVQANSGYTVDNADINYNIIHHMCGVGINLNYRVTNCEVYNNTICYVNASYSGGDSTTGIYHGTPGMSGNNIKNNIVLGPFKGTNPCMSATTTGLAGLDYNCWHSTQKWFYFDGTSYSVWATYRAAFPAYDANSPHEDPVLVNPGTDVVADYKIQVTSPCKDTGTDVSITTDYFGNTVPHNVTEDIGAHEYTYIPKVIIIK